MVGGINTIFNYNCYGNDLQVKGKGKGRPTVNKNHMGQCWSLVSREIAHEWCCIHKYISVLSIRPMVTIQAAGRLCPLAGTNLYTGWSNVTESSHDTIAILWVQHDIMQCMGLNGDDFSCYSNKIESVTFKNVNMIADLPKKHIYALSQW